MFTKNAFDSGRMDLDFNAMGISLLKTRDMDEKLGHRAKEIFQGFVFEATAVGEMEVFEKWAAERDSFERKSREVVDVVEMEFSKIGARFGDSADSKVVQLSAFREIEDLQKWKVAHFRKASSSQGGAFAKREFGQGSTALE